MKNKMWLASISVFVVLIAAACGQAKQETAVPAVASSSGSSSSLVEIKIEGFAFSPDTITVPVGTEVKWTNMDSAPHNVTSDTGSELNSPSMAQGDIFTHVFSTAGTFTYHCGVHPSMKATVIVTP
jgi:plastocyanin